jgi:hypothetical protein
MRRAAKLFVRILPPETTIIEDNLAVFDIISVPSRRFQIPTAGEAPEDEPVPGGMLINQPPSPSSVVAGSSVALVTFTPCRRLVPPRLVWIHPAEAQSGHVRNKQR